MTRGIPVRDIRFAEASVPLKSRGLLGWVCCAYGGLQLDCLRVRRADDGRYSLGFPSRVDGSGIERAYYRPLDQAERDSIERQVLGDLRRWGKLPAKPTSAHFDTNAPSQKDRP